MSVASRNPFALLNDDEPAAVTTAPAKDKAPAAATTTTAAATDARQANNTRGRQQQTNTSRGGRYYKRGGAPATDSAAVAPNPNEPGLKFDKDRGRGRGRGGGGGRGRGRDGAPFRGRAFDKQSQTGVTDSDKQIAQGWGAETGDAELADENAGWADAKDENTETKDIAGEAEKPAPDAVEGEGAAAPAFRREEEEEDNTLTFEEYQAQQREKELSAVPKLEGVRQISDDNAEWKNAKPIEKVQEEEFFASNKGKNQGPKEKAKREEKQFLDWTGGFERPQRGGREFRGGERGGRGGGRGAPRRGGRGGARGNWGNSNGRSGNQGGGGGVNVQDESAFPSLG